MLKKNRCFHLGKLKKFYCARAHQKGKPVEIYHVYFNTPYRLTLAKFM